MGLTLQIVVDGRPAPRLAARWQRLEVRHRLGDAHDAATLTLAAAGTPLPLPDLGATLVFQITPEGAGASALGGRFALRGRAGDTHIPAYPGSFFLFAVSRPHGCGHAGHEWKRTQQAPERTLSRAEDTLHVGVCR